MLASRIAALTRTLDERDRTIDGLLQRLDAARSGSAPRGLPPLEHEEGGRCRQCERVDELEARNAGLREALDRARQSDKLACVGRIATGVAHELNTPIQFVSDNVTFLAHAFATLVDAIDRCSAALDGAGGAAAAREVLAEPALAYVRGDAPDAVAHAGEGLQRIGGIVSALRRFAHASAGVPEPVDLREVIETTVAIARHEWRYVADVDIDCDARLPAVPCLRNDIGSVVLNLLVNAAQAIRSAGTRRGRIVIATRHQGDAVELSVSDDGTGMPEHVRARIFEPFFTTKPAGEGSGQGLALVRDCVVERHGGQVQCDSEPGRGTTFRIRLPLHHAEQAAA